MDSVAEVVSSANRLSWLGGAYNAALAGQLGLAPTDLECLTLLREGGPTGAGELAEALGLTTGAVTGVVDRLERAGYVSRRADPADRRRVMVEAISQRSNELARLNEPLLQAARQALGGCSEMELAVVLDCQRRLAGVLQAEVGRLRAEAAQRVRGGRFVGQDFSAPLGDVAAGRLEFANGASRVTIRAATGTGELYQARVEGLEPEVQVQDGAVTLRYEKVGVFGWNRHAADVALNPDIPWTIALRGGASKVTVDGRGLRLEGLCIDGGASELRLMLPRPSGAVSVDIGGGVSRAQISRPLDVPVELRIRGGASRLELDGQRFGAIGGDARLASPGYELADDRYDIEIA